MPLSAIAEAILQPVFEAAGHVLGYLTGSVVVPVFTFGAYRVEKVVAPYKFRSPPNSKDTHAASKFPRFISADAGTVFGLIFWAGALAVGLYLKS